MKKLMKYVEFFEAVLGGNIKLSNEAEADVFASWKVGGQDFYIYGINT